MKTLNIGKIANLAGVTVEAVRLYEKQGLIKSVSRSESGYRQFRPDAVDMIKFLLNARSVGFTLKESGELLALKATRGAKRAQVKKAVKEKRDRVQAKIDTLSNISNALDQLIESCDGKGPIEHCPILKTLHKTS